MLLSSTSSAFQTLTKQSREETRKSFQSSGIRVYLSLLKGGAFLLPTFGRLLTLGHRYASDLTPDQKDALLDVIRATPHPQISPEIRRELVTSVVRGAPRPDLDNDIVMS